MDAQISQKVWEDHSTRGHRSAEGQIANHAIARSDVVRVFDRTSSGSVGVETKVGQSLYLDSATANALGI